VGVPHLVEAADRHAGRSTGTGTIGGLLFVCGGGEMYCKEGVWTMVVWTKNGQSTMYKSRTMKKKVRVS